ncbi:MAG: hypothetical protein SCI25_04960 [Desulfuromonadales bacterium]|nr:hypothetical protein [Desulfuromonadales bacterium]MDW7758407.1 hypothetical protein [Desulfuromonadales bacterium]
MKKLLILTAITLLSAGVAFADEAELKGKVTAVSGKTVTIEVEKGDAADVSVGDAVKVEVKKEKEEKKAAPKKGKDMLMGC